MKEERFEIPISMFYDMLSLIIAHDKQGDFAANSIHLTEDDVYSLLVALRNITDDAVVFYKHELATMLIRRKDISQWQLKQVE